MQTTTLPKPYWSADPQAQLAAGFCLPLNTVGGYNPTTLQIQKMKAEKVWLEFCYRQPLCGIVYPSSSAVPFLSVLCHPLTALPSLSSPYHRSLAAIPHKQSPSLLITLLKKLFLFFLTAPSSCATAELVCSTRRHGLSAGDEITAPLSLLMNLTVTKFPPESSLA